MDEHDRGPVTTRTLTTVLRDDATPRSEAVRLVARAADQVADLHAAGRAHGAVGPDAVLVAADGTVSLTGGTGDRGRPAAPVQLRLADVHGVGRLLALAIGDAGSTGGDLPRAIEDLVRRAQVTDAPASAMAAAMRRLDREPGAVTALLPAPAPVPATAAAAAQGLLATLIPRGERRITGAAAVVLGAATTLGVALLLGGTPASSTTPPSPSARAAAPQRVAEAPAQIPGASAVAAGTAPSAQAVLDARPRTASDRTLVTLRPVALAPATGSDPTAAPRPSTSAAPSAPAGTPTAPPATTDPLPSTAPTSEPTGTATAEPTAPPTPEPTTAPTTTPPSPSGAPTAAPTTPATAVPTARTTAAPTSPATTPPSSTADAALLAPG